MKDQEILQKLGLENMPQEVQEQTLVQVNQVVETRTVTMLDELMTDKQREEFKKISDTGPEKVMEWLNKEFADVAKLYEAALNDYLDEVVARNK